MTGWRVTDAMTEAGRNVVASPARSAALAALAAALIGALVIVELATTADILAFRTDLTEAGGDVIVVYSDEGLDTGTCHDAQLLSGIAQSGAIKPGPVAEPAQSPGTGFFTAALTTGTPALLAADDAPPIGAIDDGWILGTAVANELGIEAGMTLSAHGARRPVNAVLDTETRYPQTSRWIMHISAPIGTATQCLIAFEPGATSGRTDVGLTLFAETTDAAAQPLVRLNDFSRDPIRELTERPQANAWILVGLVLTAAAWLTAWLRRSTIGLYRALGTRPATLLLIGAAEHALVVLVGAAAGALWAIAAWAATQEVAIATDQLVIAARTATSAVLLTLATGAAIWPAMARAPIATQLKDR